VAAPSATQAAVLTPPPATLPTAAPATVALAPIPAPPTPSAPTPPPAPTVSATAGTTATPENTGLQLVFKPAEADLSPDASAAVSRLVNAVPTGDTISYNVVAYATGRADDPSVARRTSLARGLAVRGALIADGVPSTRIYVRALGSSVGGSDGPTDRVDVTVMGLSGAAIPVKQ
jgi:outer membrane protein OmpA-like peptidoglycan-associated protein